MCSRVLDKETKLTLFQGMGNGPCVGKSFETRVVGQRLFRSTLFVSNCVAVRKHAVMKNTGNPNAVRFQAIEENMPGMLHTP